MSQRDSGVNRQHSLETGLTQAIRPMLICASESSVSVKNQQGSDQLSVPQTTESRMAKMKKKISSPLLKRRNPSDGVTVVGNKTFGVSIDDLLRKSDGCEVPPVVTTIVEFLEKHGLSHEGIFRISGNYKVVESLKATFDKDGEADLEQVGDVMAVAGLLKLFLRELPDPLIPQNLTAEFIKIHQAQKGDSGSLSEMKSLLEKLPSSNYQLLKYLCKFLVKVSMNEENNKMSSMALSIIFGPNLFRCKDGIEGLREQGHTNAIVCTFIEEFDTLFEVSPYATTEIFWVQEAKSNDSVLQLARKYHKVGNDKPESSASDEESSHLTGDKDRTDHKDDGPTYATVKKPKKSLHLSTNVSSSTEDLGMYVRSVSPSWNTEHSDSGLAQESPKTPEGKEIVQKVINDTIKEHLFGPELTFTDDNSPHSPESGDEGPPLPSRNYGEDETGKQRRRRRRNNKNQKQESDTSAVVEKNEREKNLINTVEFLETEGRVKARQLDKEKVTKPVKKRPKSEGYELFEREAYVIGVDNNSNNILSSTFPGSKGRSFQHKQDEIVMDDQGSYEEILTTSSGKDALSMVKRNSEMLGSLTQGRAPPPKNRRRPSLKKRKETRESFTSEQEFDKVKQTKPLVHPLVDEAKSKGKVRTTPPKSPRSGRSPRMQPSASSPRQEGDVDQVDSSPLRPRKDVLTKQYKKKHHGSPIVPPLELYKLQQQDSLPDYAQLSPRERYDGLSTEEALLSPRTRPLTVDTRTVPHECPPSPPHQQVEHSWFERRVSGSPKEEITIKQLTKAISQLKKRIREFEDAFEEKHLRRPSQSEKAPIKKFVTELGRARKQLKELKERAKDEAGRLNETVPPMGSQGMKSSSSEPLLTTTPVSIEHSLESSLKRLKEKREDDGRPEEVELMGREQLQDEKLAVQKALLQHESVFGRPSNKRDKDLMRPLYDRYRNIKRKLAMSSSESPMKVVGNRPRASSVDRLVSDLAPIHEDAPLHSPSGGSPSRMTQSLPITGRGSPRSRKAQEASFMDTLDGDDDGLGDTIQDTMTISDAAQLREDAKFHEMTQDELSEQLELKRKEKKKLRKKLKKFEDEFFEKAGRRIQREDRGDMEPDYHEYKHIKHQLKLIEALLNKRRVINTL